MTIKVSTSLGRFTVTQGNYNYRVILKYLENCENPENINNFIKDLGKFETFMKGLNKLFTEIGITRDKDYSLTHSDFETIRDFRYEVSENTYGLIINSARTVRENERKDLPITTIGEMIKNIDKYHDIKNSFKLWNEFKPNLDD